MRFLQNSTFYQPFELKLEIRVPKATPNSNLNLIQLRLGKLEFLGVIKYKNDDDVIAGEPKRGGHVAITHQVLASKF